MVEGFAHCEDKGLGCVSENQVATSGACMPQNQWVGGNSTKEMRPQLRIVMEMETMLGFLVLFRWMGNLVKP